jgi:flagella basal body P-ring formation protein FlgA
MIQVNLNRRTVRFQTTGRAEIAGRTGEWITIVNPETGKKYRGQIKGPGKVEIP